MKILLVEDDETIAMGLKYSLEKEGYAVTGCRTCADACAAWKKDVYDLCFLDINLPDGSGYDLCRRFRDTSDAPVIFLTAADAEVNVVMGLELGADDYICKPFRIHELMARIKAVMRRSGRETEKASDSGVITADRIRISTKEARVSVIDEKTGEEKPVELTALEYRLLLAFCSNRGIVLSRTALLQELWDVSGDFVNDNTLTVYIKRLRDKIERDPADPKIIKTIRGLGYRMEL
jgi:DNA-binding response OmpR family regulator